MSGTILIVEDELRIRDALQIQLQSEGGYRCECLATYADAKQWLTKNQAVDLILLDIMLPDHPDAGLVLLQQLKTQEAFRWVPVIMLTARSESKTILEALSLGASDYLIKPYNPDTLLPRIQRSYEIGVRLKQGAPAESSEPSAASPDSKRTLLARAMKVALLYWEMTTGKEKFELAQESGLWSCYLDKQGTFRTRTFDRYLSPDTLPQNPKTQLVIKTAQFVLDHCPPEADLNPQLTDHLRQLRALFI